MFYVLPQNLLSVKTINESLVSLLIKLYRQLSSGAPYVPNFTSEIPTSRFGDGIFFIGRLLNKLGRHDYRVKRYILKVTDTGPGESLPGRSTDLFSIPTDEYVKGTHRKPVGDKLVEDHIVKIKKERAAKAALMREKIKAQFKKKCDNFSKNNTTILEGADECVVDTGRASHASQAQYKGPQLETMKPLRRNLPEVRCSICGIFVQEDNQPIGLLAIITVSN